MYMYIYRGMKCILRVQCKQIIACYELLSLIFVTLALNSHGAKGGRERAGPYLLLLEGLSLKYRTYSNSLLKKKIFSFVSRCFIV